MDFAIAKISTKGQIVIPSQIRGNINPGDEFLIIKDNNRMVIKNMNDVAIDLKNDLMFAEKVEKSWQNYDKGKFKKKSKTDFLKELRAC